MAHITPEEELLQHLKKMPVEVEIADKAEVKEKPPVETISDEAKIAFLAHIMHGTAFQIHYEIANIGYVVFTTLPTKTVEAVYAAVRSEEKRNSIADLSNRKSRMRTRMALASIQRLCVGDKDVHIPSDQFDRAADAYCESLIDALPYGLLSVIEQRYEDFSSTLQKLIDGVSDRSFWPAPLSQPR